MTSRRLAVLAIAFAFAAPAFPWAGASHAQLPQRPQNLHALPRDLSTDSVFTLMLGVADALGTTCGTCHVGGDNATWDSTNFATDVKPMKVTARAMMLMTERLNRELMAPIPNRSAPPLAVTCMTCHRGALRPVQIQDSLLTIVDRWGADSAVAAYRRIRDQNVGRMRFDLTFVPLSILGNRLVTTGRPRDAQPLLEEGERLFPTVAQIALQLGDAYEKTADTAKAVQQYHRVLSLTPANRRAAQRLKALTEPAPKPHE